MRNYLLLVVSICSGVLGESVKNHFAKGILQTRSDTAVFNLISSSVAAVIMALNGGAVRVSSFTFCLSLLFGLFIAGQLILSTELYRRGPMSLGALINLCGMLIPTLAGSLLWHERVSAFQIIGIVLMLGAMALVMNPRIDRSITVSWTILAFSTFCLNGMLGLTQQVLNRSAFAGEKPGFLFYSFLTTIAISAVYLLLMRGAFKKEAVTFRVIGPVGLVACVFGITSAAQHILNLLLVSVLPSAVFFPLCNGSRIILLGLVGALIFRETLSRRQRIGFLLGLFAAMLVAGVLDALF